MVDLEGSKWKLDFYLLLSSFKLHLLFSTVYRQAAEIAAGAAGITSTSFFFPALLSSRKHFVQSFRVLLVPLITNRATWRFGLKIFCV